MRRLCHCVIVPIIITLILAAFTGCVPNGKNSDSDPSKKIIRPKKVIVGVFEPLTGVYQYAGNLELEGIRLANDLYPEVDGIKLELVIGDNQSQKIRSAQVANDLIQKEGASVLIGSWSSTLSISAGPILRDLKVPAVTPTSTNQEVTLGNDYYFRACYVDSFQGYALANYAYYDLGARTAVLVNELGNDYSKGLGRFFMDRFLELNNAQEESILEEIEFDPIFKDFDSGIEKLLAADPDIVFIPGGYNETALWIHQARESGYTGTFIGGDTWDNDVFMTYGGKSVEGVIFSSFYTSQIALTQESTVFAENYREKYGKEPTAIAALGYDAYLMVLDAVRRSASSDPEEIKNALKEIKNLPGCAGLITMNENGDPERNIIIKTIENGMIQSIKTINK